MILAFLNLDYIVSCDELAPVRVAIIKKTIIDKDAVKKETFMYC